MSLLAFSAHICVHTFVIISSGEILRSGIAGWKVCASTPNIPSICTMIPKGHSWWLLDTQDSRLPVQSSFLSFLLQSPQASKPNSEQEALGKQITFKVLKGIEMLLLDRYPWDSPGKNTGVGCHALLQGIFPTQGSKLVS